MTSADFGASDSGMATGNDAPIGTDGGLPLDDQEVALLDSLRRTKAPAEVEDPVVLRAIRDDAPVPLSPAGGPDDGLTPQFTEP
ncbi:MAG: hypothetical protein QOI42_675 [Frankiaceae bacterium]|nr:hypothetical protein [Frankiaceae bacterium]